MQPFSENSLTKDVIYVRLEKIAREELHAKIPFDWKFRWVEAFSVGNFLTRPDGLDLVEMVYRIESEFGITISDKEMEQQDFVSEMVDLIYAKTRANDLI